MESASAGEPYTERENGAAASRSMACAAATGLATTEAQCDPAQWQLLTLQQSEPMSCCASPLEGCAAEA